MYTKTLTCEEVDEVDEVDVSASSALSASKDRLQDHFKTESSLILKPIKVEKIVNGKYIIEKIEKVEKVEKIEKVYAGKVVPKKEVITEEDDPFKFKGAQTLKKYIDAYFVKCDEDIVPYTVSGLALALGISRRQLLNYESKNYYGYGDLIGLAKTRIEEYAEKRLFKGQCIGAIFALKNNFPAWIDKQETKLSGPLGGILDEIQKHEEQKSLVRRK